MDRVSVFCVLWGDKYDPAYVYALRDSVAEHLETPHDFFCITEQELDDINTLEPAIDWPGWWQKLGLWRLRYGPSLYFDLDTVITGPLDYLVPYTEHRIAAPANWGQSGHGGIQSSVLVWNGDNPFPYHRAQQEGIDSISERLWGDQEFLSELYGDDYVKLPGVYSYKYHCREKLPDDCAIVCFHGKPDPHEVFEPWIDKQRYITTKPE